MSVLPLLFIYDWREFSRAARCANFFDLLFVPVSVQFQLARQMSFLRQLEYQLIISKRVAAGRLKIPREGSQGKKMPPHDQEERLGLPWLRPRVGRINSDPSTELESVRGLIFNEHLEYQAHDHAMQCPHKQVGLVKGQISL